MSKEIEDIETWLKHVKTVDTEPEGGPSDSEFKEGVIYGIEGCLKRLRREE